MIDMKGEWTKILVFGIIFLILGFLLGRMTGHKGPRGNKCGNCQNSWSEKDGNVMMFREGGDGEHKVIIKEIEGSSFEGDTTIMIDGGEIIISKNGGEMEVEVEMNDEMTEGEDDERKEVRVIKKVIK